jgi:hypothetical protein
VHAFQMLLQHSPPAKRRATNATPKVPLTQVDAHDVLAEVVLLLEPGVAHITCKWPQLHVCRAYMLVQVILL